MVELAGLLGDPGTLAERTQEYLCSGAGRQCVFGWQGQGRQPASAAGRIPSRPPTHPPPLLSSPCADALRPVSDAERRERFSFALARTLDFGPERLQELMYSKSTAERLRAAEALVLEGRAYLAARSTLRDTF